jgi:dethiobiotin synthetase
MINRTPGLFITGTNTEVGKTYVTALITRALRRAGHRVGVYKPAASGCRRVNGRLVADDAVAVWEAAGRPGRLEDVCPQCFEAPLAPHLAAEAEGKRLDEELLVRGIDVWQDNSDVILVEGAGGLMSPLGSKLYVATLAQRFGFPLIVVVPNALGMINQTLQTVIAAECFGDYCCAGKHGTLKVAGVVLNTPSPVSNSDSESGGSAVDISRGSNRQELSKHCRPPILAEVAWQADRFDTDVDWLSLAR